MGIESACDGFSFLLGFEKVQKICFPDLSVGRLSREDVRDKEV
jgi:hypothetical protein